MHIDKFEDQIKQAFERHRPDTDNDALWENIEPHLKKKKKRRGIIFFLWGLGLGLLLLFAWFNDRKPIAVPMAATPAATPATPSGHAVQGRNQASPGPQKTRAHTETATPGRPDHTASGTHIPATPARTSSRTAPGGAPSTIAASTKNAARQQHLETPIREAAATPPALQADPAAPEPPRNTYTVTTVEGPVDDRSTPNPATPEPSRTAGHNEPDKTAGAPPAEPEKPEPMAQNSDGVKMETGKVQARDTAGIITPADKNQRRKKSKKHKYTWERNVGLQAGPALAIRHLDERPWSGTAPAEYLKARKSTESSLESFSASLFYSAIARNGLVLKAGLDYRQSNEKFHLAFRKTENEQIIGVLTQTVNSAGAVISQTTGPKTVTKTTEYARTVYNHYRYLNLPFGFGYRRLGKKSHWELSCGADINLLFRVDGAIYNRYDEVSTLKFGGVFYDDVFRHHTGFGLWAAYAYGRKLTDQLRWQVAIHTQASLRPVSAPDYELVQQYFNFGLQAGVVYRLKKMKKL